MWTQDNTEGFTDAELATINAAVNSLWAEAHAADENYLSRLNDLANNCWQDGMSESELTAAIRERL